MTKGLHASRVPCSTGFTWEAASPEGQRPAAPDTSEPQSTASFQEQVLQGSCLLRPDCRDVRPQLICEVQPDTGAGGSHRGHRHTSVSSRT